MPVLSLIDNPGFAVGLEHEIAGTIWKGGEWMVAFAQVKCRSSGVDAGFGVAVTTLRRRWGARRCVAAGRRRRRHSPEGGIEAATNVSSRKRGILLRCAPKSMRIEGARSDRSAQSIQIEEMIDRATRAGWCAVGGNASHRAQPAGLVSRALQFRP